MDALDIRNLVTAIIALVCAIGCFAYAATDQRRKAKKPVYLVTGFGFLYWSIIYTIGAVGTPIYLLRSGWLGAIGYYLLASAFIALLITDWRINERS